MDIINNETNQILNDNIDLFKFMKINKSEFKNKMFTSEYNKKLKKAYITNNKLYHTDKYPDATDDQKYELEKLFNLNQVIYSILSDENNYKIFKKLKSEIVKDHENLKEDYRGLSNDDIKDLIKKSNGGKTFE